METGAARAATNKKKAAKKQTPKKTTTPKSDKTATAKVTKRASTKKKSNKKRAPKAPAAPHGEFWKPLKNSELKFRPEVTPQRIKEFEKSLGIRLPKTLAKLLQQQNGGNLANPDFLVRGETLSVEEIPPLRERGGWESLADGYPDHLEMALGKLPQPELIFPLCGDGHWFVALDYRKTGPKAEPEMITVDLEGRISCRKIAASFDKLLAVQQTPISSPGVRLEDADPDTIIAESEFQTTHEAGKETVINHRAILCLTRTHVIAYSYESWKQPRKKLYEMCTRSQLKLTAISLSGLHVYKDDVVSYFTTIRSVLDVDADLQSAGVKEVGCTRKGDEPWKTRRSNGLAYFKFKCPDVRLLQRCRRKILQAAKEVRAQARE